jgi:hypothetical protein
MVRIYIETFTPDETQSPFCQQFGHVDGVLDVTFEGRTRQCEARHYDRNYWIIRGVLVVFPFSKQQWAAALYYFPDTGRIWLRPNDHGLQGNRWPAPRLSGFVADLHDAQTEQGT